MGGIGRSILVIAGMAVLAWPAVCAELDEGLGAPVFETETDAGADEVFGVTGSSNPAAAPGERGSEEEKEPDEEYEAEALASVPADESPAETAELSSVSEEQPSLLDDAPAPAARFAFLRHEVIPGRVHEYYARSFAGALPFPMPASLRDLLQQGLAGVFARAETLVAGAPRLERPACGIPVDENDPMVRKYLAYFTGPGRQSMRQALRRFARYRPMVLRILREYGLPEELACLPIVESRYDLNDCSTAGALGLWQIMPQRARALNLKVNFWVDERKDPERSTHAAAQYLRELHLLFDDWHLALAAYNQGEFGLMRALQTCSATSFTEAVAGNVLPRETTQFVPQFMACVIIVANRAAYGFDEEPQPPLEYDTVTVDRATDLKIAAACAGSSLGELRALNPAIRAWCTPCHYPGFALHVPRGAKKIYLAGMRKVADPNPAMGYIKYRAAPGERLETIAQRFFTTISEIIRSNRRAVSTETQADEVLLIRPGKAYLQERHG